MNRTKILFFIQIAALILFIGAAICLIKIMLGYGESRKNYEKIRDEILTEDVNHNLKSNIPGIRIDFNKLRKMNLESTGWIIGCDGEINYPIVQGVDNTYYLNHAFNKEESSSGSIFMDCNSGRGFKDFQSILYGHHMKDGSMFAPLMKYKEKGYWEKYPNFYIFTEEGVRVYEIFSVYALFVDKLKFNRTCTSKDEKKVLIKEMLAPSLYSTSIKVTPKDNIVSLVTCDYSGNDYRFVIHGRLLV